MGVVLYRPIGLFCWSSHQPAPTRGRAAFRQHPCAPDRPARRSQRVIGGGCDISPAPGRVIGGGCDLAGDPRANHFYVHKPPLPARATGCDWLCPTQTRLEEALRVRVVPEARPVQQRVVLCNAIRIHVAAAPVRPLGLVLLTRTDGGRSGGWLGLALVCVRGGPGGGGDAVNPGGSPVAC